MRAWSVLLWTHIYYGAHGKVIVGDFWENCPHNQTHSSISMSSLKHVERTNDAALVMLRVQCVCVCVVLHLDIMLFSFQRFCVFCFPDVPRCCHRNNAFCILDVSVFEQRETVCASRYHPRVVTASTFGSLSFSGRCINDVLFRVVKAVVLSFTECLAGV